MIISKKLAGLLCVNLALMLVVSCSSPEKEKQVFYEKALESIKQEKLEAAILELRSAIQLDAKFADARYQLGLLYIKKGDAKKAFGELIRAADLDPDNLDANLKVAHIYLLSRKKDECRQYLGRIFEKDPTYIDGLTLLANLELIEGNYDKALEVLARIGEGVETSSGLLNTKGRIYAAQKQLDKAETEFRKAIVIDGTNFTNYETLLFLLEEKKDLENSKLLLEEILEKFPDNEKVHLLLAGFYKSTGKPDKIEEELLKVVGLAPKNPRFRLQLAEFYQQSGKPDKAVETLVTALTEIPDNPDIAAALATQYFEQKDFAQARATLDDLVAGHPGHGGAKLLEARFALKDGKTRDAFEITQKLTHDFPAWPAPYYYLGLAHYSLGEIDLAQKAVTEAVQKDKGNDQYHTLLAQIYQVQNAFEDAKNEAAAALRLNPRNFRSAIILSQALIGTKQFKEAVAILADMRAHIPKNAEILGNLSLAYIGQGEKDKGEKMLNELLALDPGNPQAVALYIDLKYIKKLPEAETFVRHQIEKAPTDSRLYIMLGKLLQSQGKDQAALAAYEKATELNPGEPLPYFAAAKLLSKSGKREEALEKYQAMLAKHPKSLPGLMGVASLYHAEGELDKAVIEYRKILEIDGNYGPAANNLAWLLASDPNGDRGEALRLAMIAKQGAPNDPQIADTLGWVHYQRNSYALATSQFEQALQSQPDNPTWAYHLALALNGKNEKEAAIETLKKILGKGNEFPEKQEAERLLAELTQ